MALAHREAGAQPDNLCGPYWVATLVRAASPDASAVGAPTPEAAALEAGTLLPPGDPDDAVPPGEPRRNRYAVRIPTAATPEASGTSVTGMVAATEALSGGSHRLVPVRGAAGRPPDGATLLSILDLLVERPAWSAVPILNVRTGQLWGSRLPPASALAHLAGAEIEPPGPDWDVGHFLTVAGVVRGTARSMVLVRDSYPSFGWDGYYLEPPEALAAAIARGDGREGGCLLFVRAADADDCERELKDRGFDLGVWDNGTPFEQGGRT